MRNLSAKDIEKLTTAPTEANITVFRTSSECKFGNTLKNVPPAVPITVELPCCIDFFGCRGQLANCGHYATSNCQITSDRSYHNW